jgi:hypothetical protein
MCLGIGGQSEKTDRKNTLQTYGELAQVTQQQGQQGAAATGAATKRYSDLLSGDPSRLLQASAPTINAITGAADTEKKEIANLGGSRAGGSNAATQKIASDTSGKIGNVVAGQQDKAASSLTDIGAQESSNAQNATVARMSGSIGSRMDSAKINKQVSNEWGQLAASLLSM